MIVPCWNEEKTVATFFSEVSKVIRNVEANFEFLFIEDGSADNTFTELKKLADKDDRIRILRMSRNFGSFSGIAAGFEHCRGDAAIYLSADLQDSPSIIPEMISRWQEGTDIVWAVRNKREESFSRIFYRMLGKIALPNIPENGMDFALIGRNVIDVYRALAERDNFPVLSIFKLGFNQQFIDYDRSERTMGESGWPFWKKVRTAVDVIVAFSYAPVRMISTIGILAAVLGLLYALVVIFERLFFGVEVSGWASLMVVLLLVSGVQMVSLGVIAEYMWRQSKQVRHDPRYIIMEEYGAKPSAQSESLVIDVDNINVSPKR